MKKLLIIMFITLAATAVKADDVIRIVNVEEAGTLGLLLGEDRGEIDSLVIGGVMNKEDWTTLQECCEMGRLRGLDLYGLTLEKDSLPTFGLSALSDRSILKNVRLPKNVKVIGTEFLRWCTSLENVSIPSTTIRIRQGAFQFTSNLRKVELPDNLEEIGAYAFNNTGLTSIKLPSGLHYIGGQAFCYNEHLEEVTILSENLGKCGECIFYMCPKLHKVTFPKQINSICKKMFEDCEQLSEVIWPATMKKIEEAAFSGCNLRNVILPESLQEIGARAFSSNQLSSVVLPTTLERIDQSALLDNHNLTSVYSKATIPPTAVGESQQPPYAAVLYVPKGCVEAYYSAPYWHDFYLIMEIDNDHFPTTVRTIPCEHQNGLSKRFLLDGRKAPSSYKGVVIHNGHKNWGL